MPPNKYYQSLRRKKPLRCENYTVGVRTTVVSLWHENYASRFRGIQACKHFSEDWPLISNETQYPDIKKSRYWSICMLWYQAVYALKSGFFVWKPRHPDIEASNSMIWLTELRKTGHHCTWQCKYLSNYHLIDLEIFITLFKFYLNFI